METSTVIFIAAAIIGLIVVLARRSKKADAEQTGKFWRDIDALNNEATEKNRRAWFPIFEALPVLDATTSEYIHLPIYDSLDDRMHLPCAHHSYEHRFSDHGVGFRDRDDIREMLLNFSTSTSQGRPENDSTALVDGGDHFYLLRADSLKESGSYVFRIVRTGQDEYHVWSWRAGMRPSAADLDPPFLIGDILKDPNRWLRRMEYTKQEFREHHSLYDYDSCQHRGSH